MLPITDAIADIARERRRQVDQERFTRDHDDEHDTSELALAAACYAAGPHMAQHRLTPGARMMPILWPWHPGWWKPKDRRRDLVRAGALIVAEIERLDRTAAVEARAHDHRMVCDP